MKNLTPISHYATRLAMQDNRLINRLKGYWDTLRKDAPMPPWEQFNSSAIGDIWHQCCAWRVEPGQDAKIVYTYTYMGSGVKEAIGQDLTGSVLVSSMRSFPGARIVQRIDEIVKTKAPLVEESQFINEESKIVKYRSCLLPFGTTELGRVSDILLGLSWTSFK